MFLRVIFIVSAAASLVYAQENLSWIRGFTAPATRENVATNETGRQNQLNWDPQFVKLLRDAFPQRQYFWFDHGEFTPLPDLVHEFIAVPGYALLEENRYALITGCVPHDCGDRGFLWIDTESGDKPLLIFAATGDVNSEEARSGRLVHLRLFTSQKLNRKLPPEFKTGLSQWWIQTTQIWTKYFAEEVVLVTLVQPSGEEVDLSPDVFDFGPARTQKPSP